MMKVHRHFAGQHGSQRGSAAAIRHMRDIDASAILERLSGEIRSCTCARRSVVERAGFALRQRNQFLDRAHGYRGMHNQRIGRFGEQRDMCEIADRVVGQMAKKAGACGKARTILCDGVAVRWRLGARRDADGGACTGAVIHHDRLSEYLGQTICENASYHITATAR